MVPCEWFLLGKANSGIHQQGGGGFGCISYFWNNVKHTKQHAYILNTLSRKTHTRSAERKRIRNRIKKRKEKNEN